MKNFLLSVTAAVTLVCTDHTTDFNMRDRSGGDLIVVVCPDGQAQFDWPTLHKLANRPIQDNNDRYEKLLQVFASALVAAHNDKSP